MLTLARGDATLVIDPGLGARAASLVVHGLELLGRGGNDPVQWGWYPMAPWPGRIRGNVVRGGDGAEHSLRPTFQGWAMHGTVLARAWAVETADASSATLVCALGPDWPWPGEVRQTWALGDQWVDCALEVVAAGEEPYPVELGWHPWFRRDLGRGGRAQVLLDAVGQVERGPDHLPTGRLAPVGQRALTAGYDDGFQVPSGQAVVIWPGALTLTCASDCEWFTVFSELPEAVCLEPQTAPADALAAAPRLRPGDTRSARSRWTWRLP